MYSGHVAQVALLNEAVGGDASLRAGGWAFDGPANARRGVPPINYTTTQLLEAIAAQTRESATGAFPCEPTMARPRRGILSDASSRRRRRRGRVAAVDATKSASASPPPPRVDAARRHDSQRSPASTPRPQ